MVTRREQIQLRAIEILKNSPQGLRYTGLVNSIKEAYPEIPENTIHGTVWNLDVTIPKEVYKAGRGLFRHQSFNDMQSGGLASTAVIARPKVSEADFYPSFVDYLTNDLEEVTKAIVLGGNRFKDKWGTPDVIGIKKPMLSDIIKSEVVIISAEIKTDANSLITAFGQACSYKIFSHKVYLVVPKNSSEEDKSRVESLCLIFGFGLILFNNADKENPQYEIRVRPSKHEPDSFYVNKYMKLIENELFS